ncbi:MAG TPA: hypothetical protein VKZ53_28380 [Candidatus Angelobacter sp.]|nr:hypothetical protein [Candidatus Angelobacter sp.]
MFVELKAAMVSLPAVLPMQSNCIVKAQFGLLDLAAAFFPAFGICRGNPSQQQTGGQRGYRHNASP